MEKNMNKYIDFIPGIPNDKFLVTDNGRIFNMYSKRELSVSRTHKDVESTYININHCEDRNRVSKIIKVDQLVLMLFGDTHGFDVDSPFLWVFHRDHDPNNYNINNLVLCLRNTNIPVSDVYKIYDMLLNSIWDNVEISKTLGYFVPNKVITRLTRGGSARPLSVLFGYDLKEILGAYPYKVCPPKKLTDEEVEQVCKEIVRVGPDVDYIFDLLSEDMPYLTRTHIFKICHKEFFKNISDKYFKDPIEFIRGENDPPRPSWPDLPGEIWKKINDPDISLDYFVSNKGRVRNSYGRILIPKISRNTTLMIGLTCKERSSRQKCVSIARLVMTTFSINLPDILGVPESYFEVDHMDGDTGNNVVENLVWIPRGARLMNNGYSIKDVCDIMNIMDECDPKDREEIKDRIKYEVLHNSSAFQINNIIRGGSYAFLTKKLETKEWKPLNCIAGIKPNIYEVSSDGFIRRGKRLLSKFTKPLEERNFVTICGHDFRIDKLVLLTFVGKDTNNIFIVHKNGDCLDDRLENLEWAKTHKGQRTTRGKYHRKYGEAEKWVNLDYPGVEKGYSISSYGRIRSSDRRILTTKMVKQKNGKIYAGSHLKGTNGKYRTYVLRNLVYITFCGHLDTNDMVIEIDGDPHNCHYKNLKKDLKPNNSQSSKYVYNGRPVLKYNTNDELVAKFGTVYEAAEDADTTPNAIRQRISNGTIIKGFYWEFGEK